MQYYSSFTLAPPRFCFFFLIDSKLLSNNIIHLHYLHIQGDEQLGNIVTNRQANAEKATPIETSKKTHKYKGSSTWGESSLFPAITLLKNINAQGQGTLFVPGNIIYGRRNVKSTCKDLPKDEYRRERQA